MYDINSWKDCLSFIQLSVAFNFGCAILSNNPVIGLFKTLIKKSNQKATDYVQSFAPKLEKCTAWIHQNKLNSRNKEVYSTYTKLMYRHINTFESMGGWWIQATKEEPVCFSHASLLLGFYGLLELFLIPIANYDWAKSVLVVFTCLVLITLCFLLGVEIRRFKKHDEVNKDVRQKYLIGEIFLIVFYLIISFTLPCILAKHDLSILCFWNNIYDMAILLPYSSFVICFIWYIINLIINTIRDKKVSSEIKICESLYNEFKQQTGIV